MQVHGGHRLTIPVTGAPAGSVPTTTVCATDPPAAGLPATGPADCGTSAKSETTD